MSIVRGPRLLVFSDVHADDHSFIEPLVDTAPSTPMGRSSWIDFADSSQSLVDPIATFMPLAAQIKADFMLVPGDVCNKANGKALNDAWARIQEIATLVGGAEIIATVGNHDVDSRYRAHPYDPTAAIRDLDPLFPTPDENECNAFWSNDVVKLERGESRFIVLNSCAYHANRQKEIEYGRLSKRALARVRFYVDSPSLAKFNVVLCHHPPIPFPGGDEGPEDYIRNGENMLAQLDRSASHWLVLHGHRHIGGIRYGPGDFGSPVLFAAGSVGAVIPADRGARVRNQAHLIELFAEISGEIPFGGKVTTWDYTIDYGWEPAHPLDGLPSTCGFGYRGPPSALASRMHAAVERAGGPLSWDAVTKHAPEIEFLTPYSYGVLAEELESGLGLRLVPNRSEPKELAKKVVPA